MIEFKAGGGLLSSQKPQVAPHYPPDRPAIIPALGEVSGHAAPVFRATHPGGSIHWIFIFGKNLDFAGASSFAWIKELECASPFIQKKQFVGHKKKGCSLICAKKTKALVPNSRRPSLKVKSGRLGIAK